MKKGSLLAALSLTIGFTMISALPASAIADQTVS
jgi:hypothetical protein